MEIIPSKRKYARSAPRAGLVMLVRRGLTYCVRHVIDEGQKVANGVIQMMTVDIAGAVRLTGAYISPSVTGELTERAVK